jgi:hypothetical protein
LIFGAFPAISASKPDLLPALKGIEALRHPRFRWFSPRKLYVVGQVAISFVLLVISGLFIHALQKANNMAAGFEVRRLLSVRLYVAEPQSQRQPQGIFSTERSSACERSPASRAPRCRTHPRSSLRQIVSCL